MITSSIKKIFFAFFLYNFCSLFCTPAELSFTLPFTIIGLADKTSFFFVDDAGQQFLIKYHPRGPKRAIHETLCAQIGKSIGLHINEVEIFAADHLFNTFFTEINPLEPYQIGITTLHTRVPGTAIRSIKKMDKEICIKKGLRKERHLKSLTKYMQLCDIVAFDIFIDNTDRHNGNFFFDKKSGQFYVIDMDHGFKNASALIYSDQDYCFDTLATRAYHFIKTVQKRSLSSQEIKVLKRIKRNLQILIALYSPELLFDEWMQIAEKAHFSYSPREQAKIKKYLAYHIQEVGRLIDLL